MLERWLREFTSPPHADERYASTAEPAERPSVRRLVSVRMPRLAQREAAHLDAVQVGRAQAGAFGSSRWFSHVENGGVPRGARGSNPITAVLMASTETALSRR